MDSTPLRVLFDFYTEDILTIPEDGEKEAFIAQVISEKEVKGYLLGGISCEAFVKNNPWARKDFLVSVTQKELTTLETIMAEEDVFPLRKEDELSGEEKRRTLFRVKKGGNYKNCYERKDNKPVAFLDTKVNEGTAFNLEKRTHEIIMRKNTNMQIVN